MRYWVASFALIKRTGFLLSDRIEILSDDELKNGCPRGRGDISRDVGESRRKHVGLGDKDSAIRRKCINIDLNQITSMPSRDYYCDIPG